MTIQEVEKWLRAFKHSASKCDYVHEGVQAIQAQIDVIVAARKMHGGKMNNDSEWHGMIGIPRKFHLCGLNFLSNCC